MDSTPPPEGEEGPSSSARSPPSPLPQWRCALAKAVLYTGRLSIRPDGLFFTAFLFGTTKVKALRWRAIESIRAARRAGLPNALEVVWRRPDGALKSDLFVSFFSRDAALAAIITAWRARGARAPLDEPVSAPASPTRAPGAPRWRTPARAPGRGWSDAWAESSCDGGEASSSRPAADSSRRPSSTGSRPASAGTPPWLPTIAGAPTHPPPGWTVTAGPSVFATAPPRAFFEALLSGSSFLAACHVARGDDAVRVGPWRVDAGDSTCVTRELTFRAAWAGGGGATTRAPATQTQRARVFNDGSGDTLLFETSQTTTGVPMGDAFAVDARWLVAPHAGGCVATTAARVTFSRRTVWRPAIEARALDACKAAHAAALERAATALAAAGGGGARGGDAARAARAVARGRRGAGADQSVCSCDHCHGGREGAGGVDRAGSCSSCFNRDRCAVGGGRGRCGARCGGAGGCPGGEGRGGLRARFCVMLVCFVVLFFAGVLMQPRKNVRHVRPVNGKTGTLSHGFTPPPPSP